MLPFLTAAQSLLLMSIISAGVRPHCHWDCRQSTHFHCLATTRTTSIFWYCYG